MEIRDSARYCDAILKQESILYATIRQGWEGGFLEKLSQETCQAKG